MLLSPEQIAQITHAANAALAQSTEDENKLPWNCESEQFRNGVIDVIEEVAANPNITPEDMHNKWYLSKLEDGWSYGESVSEEEKTHPCMVDYDELSDVDRFKDKLFLAIVRVCLNP